MTAKAFNTLKRQIAKMHKKGKKIRFRNAPDTPNARTLLEKRGVDYINTDKIPALVNFQQNQHDKSNK